MAFNWGNAFRGGASGAAGGSSFGPWGTAIGGGIGALSGLFGDDEEEGTNKILDGIPPQLRDLLMPYINQGNAGIGKAGGAYDEMLDPNALISKIGAGYKESPGYKWRLNQGENSINNAASAGGMAGTAQHQQQAGELATNLASQDYNDYMKNALGLFGQGAQGELGIGQLGQGAASDLSTSLGNLGLTRAGLNYKRGANQNQMNSNMFSSILAYLSKNKGGG